MLKFIGKTDAARAIIENAALVPSYEAKFRQDAMVRAVHHGTHIEGNDLSKEQAEKVILGTAKSAQDVVMSAEVPGRERDIQEVINYREVLAWIDKWSAKLQPPINYSEDIFKTIHKMTMVRLLEVENSGEYRDVQVAVKSSDTGEVVFMPPPAVEVPYQIEEFFAWLNSEEGRAHHPVVRAGITHYELVRIHPFVDGNGRAARAMATLVLNGEGYDVKRFFSLEEYFDNDAARYYRALGSVGAGEQMDLTGWLEYFIIGVANELDQVKTLVVKLSQDHNLKGKLGAQVALSERQIKIIEALNQTGKMTTPEANALLPDVSPDTVLRDFKDLITKGVVVKKGRTKGAYYMLKQA